MARFIRKTRFHPDRFSFLPDDLNTDTPFLGHFNCLESQQQLDTMVRIEIDKPHPADIFIRQR